MIVYNITIKINPAIEQEWVQWQQQEHIPDILSTGMFAECKMFRLLEHDESEGITYVCQYFASSAEDYVCYINEHAPMLRQKALQRWGDQFIAFRTVMRLVN